MVDEPRLAAYVLAADPSWIEESVRSYYDVVDAIVVSFDETGTSWTGTPMPVGECLERLAAVDPHGKMRLAPGRYADTGEHPLRNETRQRTEAIAAAAAHGDWVVQLDTDEVMADPSEFVRCVVEAHRQGFVGLEYPSRVLYQHVRGNVYLEQCRRTWTVAAQYPGSMAVRADATLRLARQVDGDPFRVDFRSTSTDLAHPADAPVHRVIRQRQGIMHFSMVRSEAAMRAKARSNGHAGDFDWDPVIARWLDVGAHPVRAVLTTPTQRGAGRRFLRPARVPAAPDTSARRRNGLTR